MFEKGDWRKDESEEESDDEDDNFDLEALRRETQALEGEDDDTPMKRYGS